MPSAETRLLLLRHAAVDTGVPPGVLCGWLDLPLSRAGRAQLSAIEHLPPPRAPDAVYSSPLLRARTTAEALGKVWRTEVAFDPDLREIHCGEFEGRSIDEIMRQAPGLWAENDAQEREDFAWPGGESYRLFRRRVLGAIAAIAGRHRGERVAVVTHTGVITQVLGTLEGVSPACWSHRRAAPFSATEVLWNGPGPSRLVRFNDRAWWTTTPPPA